MHSLTNHLVGDVAQRWDRRWAGQWGTLRQPWVGRPSLLSNTERLRWMLTLTSHSLQGLNSSWSLTVDDDDMSAIVVILDDRREPRDYIVRVRPVMLTVEDAATGARVATVNLKGSGRNTIRAIMQVIAEYFSRPTREGSLGLSHG